MELPSINVLQLDHWRHEETLAALSAEDPMQKNSLMNKNEKLDVGKEQRKDNNIQQIMGWIRNNKIPDTKYANGENALELALENLKVQAETLNAKNIHLSLQQRILKPLTQLDLLCAIDTTFANSQLTVHVWTAQ